MSSLRSFEEIARQGRSVFHRSFERVSGDVLLDFIDSVRRDACVVLGARHYLVALEVLRLLLSGSTCVRGSEGCGCGRCQGHTDGLEDGELAGILLHEMGADASIGDDEEGGVYGIESLVRLDAMAGDGFRVRVHSCVMSRLQARHGDIKNFRLFLNEDDGFVYCVSYDVAGGDYGGQSISVGHQYLISAGSDGPRAESVRLLVETGDYVRLAVCTPPDCAMGMQDRSVMSLQAGAVGFVSRTEVAQTFLDFVMELAAPLFRGEWAAVTDDDDTGGNDVERELVLDFGEAVAEYAEDDDDLLSIATTVERVDSPGITFEAAYGMYDPHVGGSLGEWAAVTDDDDTGGNDAERELVLDFGEAVAEYAEDDDDLLSIATTVERVDSPGITFEAAYGMYDPHVGGVVG